MIQWRCTHGRFCRDTAFLNFVAELLMPLLDYEPTQNEHVVSVACVWKLLLPYSLCLLLPTWSVSSRGDSETIHDTSWIGVLGRPERSISFASRTGTRVGVLAARGMYQRYGQYTSQLSSFWGTTKTLLYGAEWFCESGHSCWQGAGDRLQQYCA